MDKGSSSQTTEEQSILGSLYSWGTSMMDYAQTQITSLLSTEDFEVVNPDSAQTEKGENHIDANDQRQQLWKNFEQYIGRDVTSIITVPVWIMEPFTILQKIAEIMEYTHLLDMADQLQDPHERLAYLAAYAITPYGTSERPWKPFNPILGETFELQCNNDVKFLAEQVSHHPPIGAAHAENSHFTYDIISAPKSKYLGNSIEIYPKGRTHIKLKSTGEMYSIIPPTTKACNVVVGRTWVDTYGTMMVMNVTTKDKAIIEFTPCGWFNAGRYEYNGFIYDNKTGKRVIRIYGLWNSHCDIVRIKDNRQEPINETEDEEYDEDEIDYEEIEEIKRIWECKEKIEGDYYGRSYFCKKCMSCENIAEPLMTDSRRRPDVLALDRGYTFEAGDWKYKLEEMQRAERYYREEKRDMPWKPRWFRTLEKKDPDALIYDGEYSYEDVPCYAWTGEFYERKDIKTVSNSENVLGKGFSPWNYPDIHE